MLEYESRETRHKFIADSFGEFIQGSVLNVGGGGEKHFLKYIHPTEYLELDIAGKPDIKVDLDIDYPLPINDGRFDTVICTDVLEHLDQLHRVFQELLRISRRYVIISVPNALTELRPYLLRRKYVGNAGEAGVDAGYYTKFYGLPKNRPVDRHRWFFSYTEAEAFFQGHAAAHGYRVVKELAVGVKGATAAGNMARLLTKTLFSDNVVKDLFYSAYWCVLEKHPSR